MAATMSQQSLQGVPWPGFTGGLNLRDQPNQVDPTQAVDLLNVTFVEREAVRSRDGYAKFTSSGGTNRYDSMIPFYTTGGTAQLLVGAGNRLEGISTAGAVVANTTLPTANPHFFARFGGPTAQLVYAANGTDNMRTWDGAAFAAPAYTGTAPTGKFAAVTPWDNRLVNARRSGATAGDNPSTVRFSDPGVPNTWQAGNFVDLTPGDGEQIMAVIAWSRYLFVFKETKFFRFYGTSITSSGAAVFNYETIDTGVGLASSRALCAGRDGMYFLARQGVYKVATTNVELVSELLDPFFYGVAPDFYTGGVLNQAQITQAAMAFHNERVWLAVPTGASTTNNRMLVYDPRYQNWALHDIPAAALTSFRASTQADLLFAYAAGTNDLGRHGINLTTDAGATIVDRWKSGWWDMGALGRKTVRETLLWGKGKVQQGTRVDFGVSANSMPIVFDQSVDVWADGTNSADKWADGSNSADRWGSGLQLAPKLNRQAIRGSVFSLEFANADATAWAVYRAALRPRSTSRARPY